MNKLVLAVVVTLAVAGTVAAERQFADITRVDADKAIIEYTIYYGKKKDTDVKARVAKVCVIKEGYFRLGKPAQTKEMDDIPNGLNNQQFQKATAEKPLRVNIYTADDDDKDKGIKAGDVIKILVNPPPAKIK